MTVDRIFCIAAVFVAGDRPLLQGLEIVLLQSVQYILRSQPAPRTADALCNEMTGQSVAMDCKDEFAERGRKAGVLFFRNLQFFQHHFQQQLFRQRTNLHGRIALRDEPRSDNEMRPTQIDQILIGGFAAEVVERLAVAVEVVHHDYAVRPHCRQKL